MHGLQRGSQRLRSRKQRWSMLAGSAAGLVAASALFATPWPSALLIRRVFESGARKLVTEMEPYARPERVTESLAVPGPGANEHYDVFRPAGTAGASSTIIWVHGGAWISGSRADVAPYLRILASHGYTVIGLDYPIAPEHTYPRAITSLNHTLAHILANAADLGVDTRRIVLAGDSAGAQLASQLATLMTNQAYALRLGMTPSLSPDQLVGTILHCGVYDLDAMADLRGLTAWGFKSALWAYTGKKNWSKTTAGTTMSTRGFATGDFPPTLISGGNGDGLTAIQSLPMAETLASRGVDVTPLFWPTDHTPALPHEYQFHLDLPEAKIALDDTLAFLDRITR